MEVLRSDLKSEMGFLMCAVHWSVICSKVFRSRAFLVWDDHTHKVDSCKILHDVFTVQRSTVATVAQPTIRASSRVFYSHPPWHWIPRIKNLRKRWSAHTAGTCEQLVILLGFPLALASVVVLRSVTKTRARRNWFDLDRDSHKKTIWLLAR